MTLIAGGVYFGYKLLRAVGISFVVTPVISTGSLVLSVFKKIGSF